MSINDKTDADKAKEKEKNKFTNKAGWLNIEEPKIFSNVANFKIKTGDVDILRSRWEFEESRSANVDSKIGWSTAFFVLFLSTLISLYSSLNDYVILKYIVLAFLILNIISMLILIMAMNPSYKAQRTIETSGENSLHYLYEYTKWKNNADVFYRKVDYNFHDDVQSTFHKEMLKSLGNNKYIMTLTTTKVVVDKKGVREDVEVVYTHKFTHNKDEELKWGIYHNNYIKQIIFDQLRRFEESAYSMNKTSSSKVRSLRLAYGLTFLPLGIYYFISFFMKNDQFNSPKTYLDKKMKENKEYNMKIKEDWVFTRSDTDIDTTKDMSSLPMIEQKIMNSLEWFILYINKISEYEIHYFNSRYTRPKRWIIREFNRDIIHYQKNLSDESLALIDRLEIIGRIQLETIIDDIKANKSNRK